MRDARAISMFLIPTQAKGYCSILKCFDDCCYRRCCKSLKADRVSSRGHGTADLRCLGSEKEGRNEQFAEALPRASRGDCFGKTVRRGAGGITPWHDVGQGKQHKKLPKQLVKPIHSCMPSIEAGAHAPNMMHATPFLHTGGFMHVVEMFGIVQEFVNRLLMRGLGRTPLFVGCSKGEKSAGSG